MLVKDPEALHTVTGVDAVVAKTVEDIGAVVCELHHVSMHFRPVVDSHAVGSSVLLCGEKNQQLGSIIRAMQTHLKDQLSER